MTEASPDPGIRVAIDASRDAADRRLPGMLRIFNDKAQLRMPERVLLYALIYALKPRMVLEIGTCEGGSALIIGGSLDDIGGGHIVCVDQKFQISERTWTLLSHRVTRVEGTTPGVLRDAARAAGTPFDFAFIDGDHSTAGLLRDIEGTLPLLAPQAYLLFHDAQHPDVRAALDEIVRRHSNELIDCGDVSAEQTIIEHSDVGVHVWSGFRLLRFKRRQAGGE
jgi:predicted O-methyltransferase YrrM